MDLGWIKKDSIFYPTIFLSYISLVFLIYLFIMELSQGELFEEIILGLFILYFIRMLTFLTGSSPNDFRFKRREGAKEELESFLNNFKEEEIDNKKEDEENEESETYECDNCSRKISKEQYERNDGRCPTCVAEDTHVALFDSEGREY